MLRRTVHESNIRTCGFVVPINNTIKWKKSLKKFKSKWMVEAWSHVQLFHGEGVVSAILANNFIRKEKNLRLLISFGFGHQWQKKKGNAKEAKEE